MILNCIRLIFILVFNADSLYRSYKNRLKNMPFDREHYEEQLKDAKVHFS